MSELFKLILALHLEFVYCSCNGYLLALVFCVLGTVGTIVKFSFEKLHSNDSKYEHKKFVDDEDVEDIL